ncbi:LytR/AlgR family response regulator transcription factor [Marinilabilia rubra]|uniref:DNA-binding response regulator n=1 Tax=Marinilabilia rubra TaxID=2162893 RepID=A0A2U2B6S8_9BACT|nr:LytTR family DNA-binding domain-containing protein [Marinilabilia rubra]PWD98779.1 hypothetical protein DDZ16_13655 [Marinilabilia rubra]
MYKVIIADDEIGAIDLIEELLKPFKEYEVIAKIDNAANIIPKAIELKPDLLLLDINMGSFNGVDIHQEILATHLNAQVIFCTAHTEFAIDAFNCQACDYLLKPISLSRLSQALDHFKEHFIAGKQNNIAQKKKDRELLRFNTLDGFLLTKTSDIICLEADKEYTSIRLRDNRVLHISQNIGKLEGLLPSNFLRISRSGIINTTFVSEISRKKKVCLLRWNNLEYNISLSKPGFEKLNNIFPIPMEKKYEKN